MKFFKAIVVAFISFAYSVGDRSYVLQSIFVSASPIIQPLMEDIPSNKVLSEYVNLGMIPPDDFGELIDAICKIVGKQLCNLLKFELINIKGYYGPECSKDKPIIDQKCTAELMLNPKLQDLIFLIIGISKVTTTTSSPLHYIEKWQEQEDYNSTLIARRSLQGHDYTKCSFSQNTLICMRLNLVGLICNLSCMDMNCKIELLKNASIECQKSVADNFNLKVSLIAQLCNEYKLGLDDKPKCIYTSNGYRYLSILRWVMIFLGCMFFYF